MFLENELCKRNGGRTAFSDRIIPEEEPYKEKLEIKQPSREIIFQDYT